jgi:spore coat polysaccharide biosynthesis protein SpsF (cytidylyltransferase family)
MTKKVIIILQARCGSKRLPNKVLKKIKGVPMAVLCAKRLKNTGKNLIVATSIDNSDDKLIQKLKYEKINYFRGEIDNVLSRYIEISKKLKNNDIIIRATADNPVPDGILVDELIKEFKSLKVNFFRLDHKLHNLPRGICLEIFTVSKIRELSKLKLSKSEREHVTLRIYKKKEKNIIESFKLSNDLSNLNFSVDTKKNLKDVRRIFSKASSPTRISWKKLLKFV